MEINKIILPSDMSEHQKEKVMRRAGLTMSFPCKILTWGRPDRALSFQG